MISTQCSLSSAKVSRTLDEVARERAQRCEEAQARDVALRASLLALVRLIDEVGGYLKAEHQVALRRAKALLAQVGK